MATLTYNTHKDYECTIAVNCTVLVKLYWNPVLGQWTVKASQLCTCAGYNDHG